MKKKKSQKPKKKKEKQRGRERGRDTGGAATQKPLAAGAVCVCVREPTNEKQRDVCYRANHRCAGSTVKATRCRGLRRRSLNPRGWHRPHTKPPFVPRPSFGLVWFFFSSFRSTCDRDWGLGGWGDRADVPGSKKRRSSKVSGERVLVLLKRHTRHTMRCRCGGWWANNVWTAGRAWRPLL